MDMTREALEYIAGQAQAGIIDNPKTGEQFNGKTLERIDRKTLPTIHTFNLSAIVNGIGAIIKAKPPVKYPLFVQVIGPQKVLVTTTPDENRISDEVIMASFEDDSTNRFTENFMPYEDFMIRLNSRFVETNELSQLRTMLANISSIESDEVSDDGITQKATFRQGVSMKREGEVKAKFRLSPYRTFLEVNQPESEYLLRVNQQKNVALFLADGGLWKYKAVDNIREYLILELEKHTHGLNAPVVVV